MGRLGLFVKVLFQIQKLLIVQIVLLQLFHHMLVLLVEHLLSDFQHGVTETQSRLGLEFERLFLNRRVSFLLFFFVTVSLLLLFDLARCQRVLLVVCF